MRTEEQIKEELKIRENIKNSPSYSGYRTNKTIIETLKWILNIPTMIKSHYKK